MKNRFKNSIVRPQYSILMALELLDTNLQSSSSKVVLRLVNYDGTILDNLANINTFAFNVEFHFFLPPKIISTQKQRWTIRINLITSNGIEAIRWLSPKNTAFPLIPIESSISLVKSPCEVNRVIEKI